MMRTRPYRDVQGASGTDPGDECGIGGAGDGVVQFIEQGLNTLVVNAALRTIVAE
jgi:hypothetical protein